MRMVGLLIRRVLQGLVEMGMEVVRGRGINLGLHNVDTMMEVQDMIRLLLRELGISIIGSMIGMETFKSLKAKDLVLLEDIQLRWVF